MGEVLVGLSVGLKLLHGVARLRASMLVSLPPGEPIPLIQGIDMKLYDNIEPPRVQNLFNN